MRLKPAVLFTFLMLAAFTAFAAEKTFTLTASATQWEVGAGQRIAAHTYNGTLPGPELRVAEGDIVRVTLHNRLPEATTIHWHGVPVPNGMDGVPGISAPVIAPGRSFTYVFTAPSPGTYWYHPHANSAAQIARGLYGLLIVEPPETERDYDREVPLVIGESPMMNNGGGGGMMGNMGAMSGLLLINGRTGPHIPDLSVRLGERVLFRIVNTGNMVHPLHLHGLHWTVTATDGFPLPAPYRKDTLPVNAGERYDALLVADNPGTWMLHCHNLLHTGDDVHGLSMRVLVSER